MQRMAQPRSVQAIAHAFAIAPECREGHRKDVFESIARTIQPPLTTKLLDCLESDLSRAIRCGTRLKYHGSPPQVLRVEISAGRPRTP
jgi:hypothetical protein